MVIGHRFPDSSPAPLLRITSYPRRRVQFENILKARRKTDDKSRNTTGQMIKIVFSIRVEQSLVIRL